MSDITQYDRYDRPAPSLFLFCKITWGSVNGLTWWWGQCLGVVHSDSAKMHSLLHTCRFRGLVTCAKSLIMLFVLSYLPSSSKNRTRIFFFYTYRSYYHIWDGSDGSTEPGVETHSCCMIKWWKKSRERVDSSSTGFQFPCHIDNVIFYSYLQLL